jgi:hypothetical protein
VIKLTVLHNLPEGPTKTSSCAGDDQHNRQLGAPACARRLHRTVGQAASAITHAPRRPGASSPGLLPDRATFEAAWYGRPNKPASSPSPDQRRRLSRLGGVTDDARVISAPLSAVGSLVRARTLSKRCCALNSTADSQP